MSRDADTNKMQCGNILRLPVIATGIHDVYKLNMDKIDGFGDYLQFFYFCVFRTLHESLRVIEEGIYSLYCSLSLLR